MPTANRSSRRQWLARAAGLAAGSVALPCVLPSGLLAAKDRPGPNDRIGLAGIGIGRQGADVAAAAAKHGQFVAIADINLPRAKAMAERFKCQAAYQDYRRVLDRKDVDAVVTATPDHWRALVCIHCCQAEKDVYAEKPLTLTIREGRAIVKAVNRYKRVLQTGSQQRSMAANRLGCELVRNGRIGKVSRIIASNYPSPWTCGLPAQDVPEGLDWDVWCGPNPVVPYNKDLYTPRAKPGWISFWPYSGGEVTGWGSHGLDQVQWALGMDESGPIEIWTEGEKWKPLTYTEPEPVARGNKLCASPRVFMRYAGDIVMELTAAPSFGAVFIGEKGKIDIQRGRCTSDPAEIAKEPIKDGEIHLEQSNSHTGNWIDCIRTRKQPVANAEVGHRSATVCHLMNIARWVGRPLKWDPLKEQFLGDDEANKWLDIPRRKGYELPEA